MTPKPIDKQLLLLQEFFPSLKKAKVNQENIDPRGSGLFAIPHWKLLGKTYNEVTEIVLAKIGKSREFHNWRQGKLGPEYLRQSNSKVKFWETQKKGIVLLSCQLGQKYKGRSVMDVRQDFKDGEFGLGAYEVGIILLTHPELLKNYDDLWLDCAGDEYDYPGSDDRVDFAPCFDFYNGRVEFGTRFVSDAYDSRGAVSAFRPQSNPLPRPLDPLEPSALNLESALKIVKESGYKVFKEI